MRILSPRRIAVVVIVSVSILGLDAGGAGAAADGGARSRVVGRGDIVTSIIGWRQVTRSTATTRRARPRCVWITLQDGQIEWVTALAASTVAVGGPNRVLDALRGHLGGDELPDGDLQARVCDGVAVDARFVPRTAPIDTVQLLHRQMITRLPAPDPLWSPAPNVAVPLHQPIFVSIPASQWRPITNTITEDGITAEVRAEPVGMRVISGDPAGGLVTCDGPGRPFDVRSPVPVRRQALGDGACSFRYLSVTSAATGERPDAWIGTVTVLWRAEWRSGAGEWSSLGIIPRTRLFDRTAREVTTSIESTR